MPSVFISYAHSDQEFAETLGRKLTARGVSVWYDQTHIKAGDSLITTIAEGVRSVDFVVVVLSPNSAKSWWVVEETNLAFACKIPVVPLMLIECDPPGFLKARAYLSFVKPSSHGDMFDRLFVRIGLDVNGSSSSIKGLLDLQRKFLEQPIEISGLINAMTIVIGLAVVSVPWVVAFGSVSVVGQLVAHWGFNPPEWIGTVAGVLGFLLGVVVFLGLGWTINVSFPPLIKCAKTLYIRFRYAPRLARIALQSGIETSLAVQAYESSVGTVGLEDFRKHLIRAESQRNK